MWMENPVAAGSPASTTLTLDHGTAKKRKPHPAPNKPRSNRLSRKFERTCLSGGADIYFSYPHTFSQFIG